MKIKNITNWKKGIVALFTIIGVVPMSCKKFLDVPTPYTSTNAAVVYSSNSTAAAVLTSIYQQISTMNGTGFGTPNIGSTSLFVGLSADDFTLTNPTDITMGPYYQNALNNTQGQFWQTIYPLVYTANAAIDGLGKSTGLSPAVEKQLMGEAKFMRAFFYFYLTNLYGDVPLVTNTDYVTTALLPRTPKDAVMAQVIADLKDAQGLLSSDFVGANAVSATTERVRPTKWAAMALLARAYLYTGDYADAVTESSEVIANTTQFGLDDLNDVFLKNSTESIWQIQATGSFFNANTGEGQIFIMPPTGPDFQHIVYLNNDLVNSFEPGDERKTDWVNSVTVGTTTYYYPFKYKIGLEFVPPSEYSTVFRLAEQYLIRAEAYAQLDKTAESATDLNTIRTRAGLGNTLASTKADLLTAIMRERRIELFSEWGHRWFDLKRTGTVDAVMSVVTPLKGGTWNTNWELYPLPLQDLTSDHNLKQNPGY